MADATCREVAADRVKSFGGGIHYVMVDRAVYVDIKEGRGKDTIIGAGGGAFNGLNEAAPVDGNDRVNPYLRWSVQTRGGKSMEHLFQCRAAQAGHNPWKTRKVPAHSLCWDWMSCRFHRTGGGMPRSEAGGMVCVLAHWRCAVRTLSMRWSQSWMVRS